jgi:2-hydroxychromene-2-carboxylate isomerase
MGKVTVLATHRATRRGRGASPQVCGTHQVAAPVAFYFDPCCPFSYLAAERIERRFSSVEWIPVPAGALQLDEPWSDPRVARLLRLLAQRRAGELRLPLVWPEHFPLSGTAALRVAVYAGRVGVGPAFALAASRLAFCGGYDLDDPANLAEAAAAAGIEFDAFLAAAYDPAHDEPLWLGARDLLAHGVTQLPALKVGSRWFTGEASLVEASAWWAHTPMLAAAGPA